MDTLEDLPLFDDPACPWLDVVTVDMPMAGVARDLILQEIGIYRGAAVHIGSGAIGEKKGTGSWSRHRRGMSMMSTAACSIRMSEAGDSRPLKMLSENQATVSLE